MRTFRLSKSRIAAGLQCGRRLWLQVHRPELVAYDAAAQRRFCSGDDVGRLARILYGPGDLIDGCANLSAALRDTELALAKAGDVTLFEATFRHRGVLVRGDILRRRHGTTELIEVKSATRLKEHHLQDVAIQAWTTEGAGLHLDMLKVAVIDTAFVYPGGGDYGGLLREVPVSDQVRPLMARVPVWVRELNDVLAGPCPACAVGAQCHKPYDCPFVDYCEGRTGARPIERGAGPVRPAAPSDPRFGTVHPSSREFLAALPYPRYYLDFEAAQSAIPVWRGTRPYQQIVFQWSCHVEDAPGRLRHCEHLDLGDDAPMRAAAESLLAALRHEGPIFVYHDFEKWRLLEMEEMFPDLAADLERASGRLVDLQRLVRDAYAHPDLGGSCSLKSVVRTIAPELDYAQLEDVNDGYSAQAAYHEARASGTPFERRKALAGNLREYCARDTLALVRVAQRLGGAPEAC